MKTYTSPSGLVYIELENKLAETDYDIWKHKDEKRGILIRLYKANHLDKVHYNYEIVNYYTRTRSPSLLQQEKFVSLTETERHALTWIREDLEDYILKLYQQNLKILDSLKTLNNNIDKLEKS